MKFRIFYILTFLFSIISYGQVTLISAVEDKEYKVNDKITLTFILRINGDELEQETPLRLPDFSKFNVIGNASDQNSYIDPEKKIVVNEQVVQYAVSPKETGKIRIGSALVTVNGKIYKTEPIDIIVKEADKKVEVADNSKDVYLNVELKNQEVYENQPVVAVLRVYSKDFDNFRKIHGINLPQQGNINVRPVSFAKSDIEQSPRREWSSQVVAIFMIFPNESGRIDVPPVSASIKNNDKSEKISSNRVSLKVKTLPKNSPENYKNAVGNFDVSIQNISKIETTEIYKPIDVLLKISGEGNLATMNIPKIISSEDYEIFKPNITTVANATKKGVSGEISAHYVLIPKRLGKIAIKTEDFSYFNPEENTYADLGPKILQLEVMSPEQISQAKSTLEKVNEYTNTVLETVKTPVLDTSKLKVKDKKTINWKIVLANLFLVFVLIYGFYSYLKFKRLTKENESKNNDQKPIVSVAEAEAQIRENMNPDYEAHLSYIKNLHEQKNYAGFFTAFEELQDDLEKNVQAKNFKNLQEFVEKEKGSAFSERFRTLQQKIQIEKYAPLHTEEHMKELNESIQTIYSEIVK